ncbi:hypothetical protein QYE76_008360 [Lolium multiflorum]|uniref:Protein FAR1-RELATED SEQUENCE n=1 Tax=Lolium multiflorum TaxID=4521 RepID=A0AAD8QEA6_LOLMU|nr:hypothetical protein QYE76_008360 [Lolium multiflorum]
MDTTKPNESGKTQQEDGTTAAESIFGSMTGKTPIQCRRMVDKFAQAFLQRRKEKAELESLAELQAVEESFYMHKQKSEVEGHMSSNITRANKQKCMDFDLNEVLKFDNEDNEGYADSNIPEMHVDGASFAGENACLADNADYSNGVDNYGKTVVFGVGLLEDERADTFKWLFEEFLSAVDNKHPETIITDQDVAMRIAISEALPYTVHRFCNFHISKNLDDKLSLFFAVRGTLKEELRAVIRNSFTPEEFENDWHALLDSHNALGEPHLDRIYDIRDQWVPAYFKENFFPFTSSTGRSESTNSLFKHYVKRKDSIATFFKEYIRIQEKKQSDLDRLREKSEFKESVNWGFNPIEREAMKIYTDPIYGKFAEELRKCTAYNVEVVEEKRLYRVIRVTNYRTAEFPRSTYMVSVSPNEDVYKCSCSKMARDGIQCCHVMRVVTHIGLTELPVSFINPRWTTAAGIEVARLTERRSNTASQNTHLVVRHAIEMSKISHIISTVCTDDRSYDLFAEGVAELKKAICKDAIERLQTKEKVTRKRKKVDDPVQQDTDNVRHEEREDNNHGHNSEQIHPEEKNSSDEETNEDEHHPYKDPPQSGNPGFNLGDRPMNFHEKSAAKLKKKAAPRLCGLCRLPGHKRPKCPDRDKVLY